MGRSLSVVSDHDNVFRRVGICRHNERYRSNMARPRRAWCRICDRHVSECGPLSARGKCQRCSVARLANNITAMHEHKGEAFDNWRRQVAASVGAVLLDDL
jgi:hypothetical protein